MHERMRRLVVATAVALSVAAAGAGFATPADAASVRPVSTTDAVAVASETAQLTTGVNRIYVSVDSMTTATTDDTNIVPADSTAAAAFVAQLNTYWNRETGGAVSLVLGGFETRAVTVADCSVTSLYSAARSVDFSKAFATTASWSGTNNHLLAMSREGCSSSSVGQGSVGGAGGIMATIVGSGASVGLAVAAHEFGHNLGFLHANASTCPAGTDSGSTCAETPYGDYLDVMGGAVAGSLPHESTPQLISLGYLTAYSSLSQTSGVVQQTLMPVGATSGIRSLRITDPTTKEQYFVEYRVADSTDAASPEFSPRTSCTTVANGLPRCWGGMSTSVGGIRILRVADDGTSVLSVGTNGSTHLDLGQSFTNHDSAFSVTVTSLSPTSGAVVTVAFGSSIAAATTSASTAAVSSTASVSPTISGTAASGSAASSPYVVVPVRATAHVSAKLRRSSIARGAHPIVVARVTGHPRPTGILTVWGNGHRLRAVNLRGSDAGVRTITLPRRTGKGTLVIRVTYSGSTNLSAASSGTKRLLVR